jgi:ABC-type polar amino acid transport system ATPase subunit
MIDVRHITKNHGALRVLDGASLAVGRGEVAAVIGPSGGGKSTLLRCINGLERFEAGEIQIGDVVLGPNGNSAPREPEPGKPQDGASGDSLRALRQRVGMVFQQFNLFPHMTALENVCSGPRFVLGHSRQQAEAEARSLLERVGLGDKLAARPAQLSGGQQQRVAIARALAMRPEAILFDEPTSALDPRMAAEVIAVIVDLAKSGQTMVVVTHSMNLARALANTVHVMHGGRVVEAGPPTQVFQAPQTDVTRAFLSEARTQ